MTSIQVACVWAAVRVCLPVRGLALRVQSRFWLALLWETVSWANSWVCFPMCEPCVCAASTRMHAAYAHCSEACANCEVFCLCGEFVSVCVRHNTKRRMQSVLRERWASFPQIGQEMTPLLFPHLRCLAAFSFADLTHHRGKQRPACAHRGEDALSLEWVLLSWFAVVV